MATKNLHVAIISSPGVGHLVPILLLGHRLVTTDPNLHVTVLSITTTTTKSPLLTSFPTNKRLSVTHIPAADISSVVASDASVITRLCVMMRETMPAIRNTISSMDPRPHVLLGDIFTVDFRAIAQEFRLLNYVYITGSAWFTGLFTYSPVLDKEVVGQYVDQKEPFEIPGCRPVRPEEVVDPMPDRNDEAYGLYLELAVGATLTDGMLIDTWEDLEPQSLDALRNNEILRSIVKGKPVYTVGPVVKRHEPDVSVSKSEVIEWLDKQPNRSVIYVSFGSGGTISVEQIKELAWGLELSQQRFVWVVRPPSGKGSDGSFFKPLESCDGLHDYFPEGFLSRTQKVGLVVPSWGPQVEILNHTSVGGFLSHCGWNSTLESITSGVPMIAWPLYAEQKMNATMLAEELKVAVRPEVLPTKKVVGREEVERLVRVLMAAESEQGKAMREKVMALKKSAERAINEKGSSYDSICKFIEDCRCLLQ